MNTLEIKRLKIPSDYETAVFVIDGRPLYEYLNEWVNGDEQLLDKPDMLAICWTDDYDFEEEKRHGILYLISYTDEDWEKYGDNIALEEVDSRAWHDWIGKNWTEELYRRRINYTYSKYQDEENIDWIAECNFVFNRKDYDRLVESCYENINSKRDRK